jgi:hypothetical protein
MQYGPFETGHSPGGTSQAAALPDNRHPKRRTPIGVTPAPHFPASTQVRYSKLPTRILPFTPVGITEMVKYRSIHSINTHVERDFNGNDTRDTESK